MRGCLVVIFERDGLDGDGLDKIPDERELGLICHIVEESRLSVAVQHP